MEKDRSRAPIPGLGVLLISTSLLAFEIILVRLFAVETFHHFAYMAIGVALLGFGASGTLLVLIRTRIEGREREVFGLASVALPVALIAAPTLGHVLEFEPTQLLWDWRPWLGLTVLYVCLALPFFVGATAITLALMQAGPRIGSLYAWSMIGSGVGGLLGIGLLYPLRPDAALAATVVPALPGAITELRTRAASRFGDGRRGAVATWIGLLLLCGGTAWALVSPPWTVRITPFKGLPQVEAFPDSEREAETWGPTGWVAAVRAPAFHHAPGLSLAYRGHLPRQVALFVDGETSGAATEWAGRRPTVSFLEWLPSTAPYALAQPASVLVLGSGDGLQVLNALAHGAERVTAVELVRPLLALADEVLPESSRVYSDPRVAAVAGDARSFTARTDQRFDLIVLATSGTFAVGASGIHGTGESYLETAEAYRQFLDLLEPEGTLAVTRWLRTPARDNLKLIFTVAEALEDSGLGAPEDAMAFVRSWATGTLLVRPDGFGADDMERLRSFTDERLFDVDWPEGVGEGVYNVLERPVFTEAVRAVAEGDAATETFISEYPFDVSPATDDRPYFGQFLRPSSLPALLAEDRAAWLPVAEWGYLAVWATLIQSAALSLVLLGVPVVVLTWSGRKAVPIARTAAYFWAIGFGFMFVELAAIQRLGLVLGHPVFATATTLATLLVFSGIGSAASDRFDDAWASKACSLIAVAALIMGILATRAGALVSWPFQLRAAASLVAIGIPGFLMGLPFPMGLRRLAPRSVSIAWAWAANGVASVIGASLATLLAMEIGGSGLIFTGAACYAAAAVVVGSSPPHGRVGSFADVRS